MFLTKNKQVNTLFIITTISLFIAIIIHLTSFKQIPLFLHAIVFLYTISTIYITKKYNLFYLLFILFWLFILLLHFIFKGSLEIFGYLQYFFYASCFYTILKSSNSLVSPKILLNLLEKIYKIIIFTLIIELIFNLLGLETLLLRYFSGDSVGKHYQILASRPIMALTGIEFNGLNSILFGPQSASLLLFYFLLLYNPYDKFRNINSKLFFYISVILFFIANTMTLNIIMLIVILYFMFFSKISRLNNLLYKLIIGILILVSGLKIFSILFSAFQDEETLNIYIYLFSQPFVDIFNLSFKHLLFGLAKNEQIRDFTSTWEVGFIQIVYLIGFMPILFFFLINHYLIRKLLFFRKNRFMYIDYYILARHSVFVIIASFLSLIHYASMFSTGFFQLIGLHISIALYSFDIMSSKIKS